MNRQAATSRQRRQPSLRKARLKSLRTPLNLTPAAEIDALCTQSKSLLHSDAQAALTIAQSAYDISLERGDTVGLAKSLCMRGSCNFRLSRYADAEKEFNESIALARTCNALAIEARALVLFGLMRINQGNYTDAIQFCRLALKIASDLEHDEMKADAYTGLGIAFWNYGDYEDALEMHLKAFDIIKHYSDKQKEAQLLTNIGTIYNQLGDHDSALKYHTACLRLSRSVNDLSCEAIALNNLTYTYWKRGDVVRSAESQSACLELKRRIGDRRGEALSLINLSELELHFGRSHSAMTALDAALKITRDIGDRHTEVRSLYARGQLSLKLHRTQDAIHSLSTALELAEKLNAKPEQIDCLYALAQCHERIKHYKQSIACYKRAFELEKESLQTKAAEKLQHLQSRFQVEQAIRENERLEKEIQLKRRSLQASALAITNKNETLKSIRKDLVQIRFETGQKARALLISNLISRLDSNIDSERAWSLLEKELSVLNHDVMQRLANRFPELSPQELKICSMLREDIKTKQIALLLNLSPRTIEKHRENIRRTFQLAKQQSLSAFLASI
jgi:tetratricopeptide (TPR) repeat protein